MEPPISPPDIKAEGPAAVEVVAGAAEGKQGRGRRRRRVTGHLSSRGVAAIGDKQKGKARAKAVKKNANAKRDVEVEVVVKEETDEVVVKEEALAAGVPEMVMVKEEDRETEPEQTGAPRLVVMDQEDDADELWCMEGNPFRNQRSVSVKMPAISPDSKTLASRF